MVRTEFLYVIPKPQRSFWTDRFCKCMGKSFRTRVKNRTSCLTVKRSRCSCRDCREVRPRALLRVDLLCSVTASWVEILQKTSCKISRIIFNKCASALQIIRGSLVVSAVPWFQLSTRAAITTIETLVAILNIQEVATTRSEHSIGCIMINRLRISNILTSWQIMNRANQYFQVKACNIKEALVRRLRALEQWQTLCTLQLHPKHKCHQAKRLPCCQHHLQQPRLQRRTVALSFSKGKSALANWATQSVNVALSEMDLSMGSEFRSVLQVSKSVERRETTERKTPPSSQAVLASKWASSTLKSRVSWTRLRF